MKLRNHTDHVNSAARATAMFTIQPPLTDDELGALDTQEIATVTDDTAPLDADIDDLIAFGARLDAMNETENEDE